MSARTLIRLRTKGVFPVIKLKNAFAFLVGAALCGAGAWVAVGLVESRTAQAVEAALSEEGHDWADVETDGLLVALSGQAPDEATRFRVVTAVGRRIDPDRIVDQMDVKARSQIAAPKFSVEMLRNDDGVSLIGLIPEATDRDEIVATLRNMTDSGDVTDMLDAASFATPSGWDAALDFAMNALRDLPKSKISVSADEVTITAISSSLAEKRKIEADLARQAPRSVRLALNITAPRPVISPYTLRFTLGEDGVAFDACSAPNEASKSRILAAAAKAGVSGKLDCAIGLGVPSPNWTEAVETAIQGLQDLGGGSLTFSDADITLVALDTTAQGMFDRVVGDLDATLPDVFSLHAVLPEKIVVDGTGEAEGVIEFVATHSPEGLLQLRGRLTDDDIEQIVGSYARAQFGSKAVYLATRDDPNLPQDWPIRVLTSLEALAMLEHGSVVVQPAYVEIRGVTGSKGAASEVSQLLADKLGESQNFDVSIRYDELLDPTLNIPTPDECVEKLNRILASSKIAFEPSSAEITDAANGTIDQMAELVRKCDRVQMEIGGHTDSQGREIMNLQLSQERAEAVLAALLERRVLTRHLSARGYGETVPIADNKTEEGREANRRIEFRLLTDVRKAEGDEGEAEVAETDDTPRESLPQIQPEPEDTPEDETQPETEAQSEQN